MQPNRERVAELKKNTFVAAWIECHQKRKHKFPGQDVADDRYADCHVCGWPHDKHIACGGTFGCAQIGGESYSIDGSNVDYMLHFMDRLGGLGFHWRDGVFFDARNEHVIITHIEQFNNTPQLKTWAIPVLEWQSIVGSVERSAIQH